MLPIRIIALVDLNLFVYRHFNLSFFGKLRKYLDINTFQ